MRRCIQGRVKQGGSKEPEMQEQISTWEHLEGSKIMDVDLRLAQDEQRLQQDERQQKAMADSLQLLARRISLLEDVCRDHVDLVTVCLIPGHLRVRIDWARGVVMGFDVFGGALAQTEGVDVVGWYVHMIDDQLCSKDRWDERVARGNPFKVSFQRPRRDGLAPRMQGMVDQLDDAFSNRLEKLSECIIEQRRSIFDAIDNKLEHLSQQGRLELDAMDLRVESHENAVRTQLQERFFDASDAVYAHCAHLVSDSMCTVTKLREDVKELRTRLDDVCSSQLERTEFDIDFLEKIPRSHVQRTVAEAPKPCTYQSALEENPFCHSVSKAPDFVDEPSDMVGQKISCEILQEVNTFGPPLAKRSGPVSEDCARIDAALLVTNELDAALLANNEPDVVKLVMSL